jgi:drug/metabolite transporter (DMT)-like permease
MHGSHQHTSVLPILSLLLAATLWGVFWWPLRWLEGMGLRGLWVTFFIYLGTTVFMLPLMWGRWHEVRRQPWILLAIILSSGWCNTAFILAMLEGQVVRVLILFYLSPVWATLLGWLVLKEHLSRRAILVLVVAMLGALIMLYHPQTGYPWPEGSADWYALSSGLAFALTNMFVRMDQQSSFQVKTVFAWLGVILVAAVALWVTRSSPPTTGSATAIVAALLVGVIMMSIMTFSVVYGVTHMPVHRSAVILLFELIAGAVSAQLLTDEHVRMLEWIGGALILAAAYLSAERQVEQEKVSA